MVKNRPLVLFLGTSQISAGTTFFHKHIAASGEWLNYLIPKQITNHGLIRLNKVGTNSQ
jgi:hypothetical protein